MENNGDSPRMVCTVHSCFEYIYKKNRLFGKKRATTRIKHIYSKENNHILSFPTSFPPCIVETPFSIERVYWLADHQALSDWYQE